MVRDGKGAKDRVTMLPVNLAAPLQRHLMTVRPPPRKPQLRDRAIDYVSIGAY
jgi:hypothetical protein